MADYLFEDMSEETKTPIKSLHELKGFLRGLSGSFEEYETQHWKCNIKYKPSHIGKMEFYLVAFGKRATDESFYISFLLNQPPHFRICKVENIHIGNTLYVVENGAGDAYLQFKGGKYHLTGMERGRLVLAESKKEERFNA